MTKPRKPWVYVTIAVRPRAWCERCGARSVWVNGHRTQDGKPLTYERWWQGFKKHHDRCDARITRV